MDRHASVSNWAQAIFAEFKITSCFIMGGKGKGEGKGKRDTPVCSRGERALTTADHVPDETPMDEDNPMYRARSTTVDVSGRPLRNGLIVLY